MQVRFDDSRSVADAGLILAGTSAERLGLERLIYGNEGRIRLQTLDRQSKTASSSAVMLSCLLSWRWIPRRSGGPRMPIHPLESPAQEVIMGSGPDGTALPKQWIQGKTEGPSHRNPRLEGRPPHLRPTNSIRLLGP